jgi:hypothetical protein
MPRFDLFELPVELRAALDPLELAHHDAAIDRVGGAVELRESGLEELVSSGYRAGHLQDGHEGRRLAA